MLDQRKIEVYFIQVLHHLAKVENRNKEFHFDNLLLSLSIPEEYGKMIFNKLWTGERYIDGKAALRNPLIKINQKGIYLSERLLQEVQKENKKLQMEDLQKTNFIATTKAAAESIKRSKNAERIAWIAVWIAGASLALQLIIWVLSLRFK